MLRKNDLIISVSKSLKEKLEEIEKKKNIKISTIIRMLIYRGVKEMQKNNNWIKWK